MKLRDFGLLTDENLDPDVVAFLRQTGFDVWDVCDNGRQGTDDLALMKEAFAQRRIIVTHDADFGTLAVLQGEPIIGILYLRPGHIDPQFTVESLEALMISDPDVDPPFVIVARRSGTTISIRVRRLVP